MAVDAKVGTFTINTSLTAGQTQAISGVGFQPKVVIFWWSGQTSGTDAAGSSDINLGIGWMVDATHRNALAGFSLDGSGTTDTGRQLRDDSCIANFTAANVLDGLADFSSFDSDGFTLVIDNAFALAMQVSYLALGGSDITDAITGTELISSVTGDLAISGLGFQPSVVLMAMNNSTGLNGIGGAMRWHLGWATGTATAEQGNLSMYSSDGAATSVVGGYLPDGEAFGAINSTASVFVRATLVSFDADGFTLNFAENTSTANMVYLAIGGGNWQAGGSDTQTDTSTATGGTTDFTPDAVMFFSAARTKSTNNAASANGHVSIGAATGSSERVAQAVWMESGVTGGECATAIEYDEVYINIASNDTVQGLMDVTGFSGTGWAGIMDDADPSAAYVAWLAVGGAGATQYEQNVGGALTPTGSLIKQTSKTQAGSLTPTGSLIKKTSKTSSGSVSPAGSITKQIRKTFTGAVSATGALLRQTRKTLSGAVSPSGALGVIKTFLRSLSGSVSPSGQLARLARKALGGSVSPAGSIIRQINLRLSGIVDVEGDLRRALGKTLSGEVSPSGALDVVKTILRSLSGSVSPSGSLAAGVRKFLSGSVSPTGTLAKRMGKRLSGVVAPSGRLVKRMFVRLSGAVTPISQLVRRLLVETLGFPATFRSMWRGMFKGRK